MTRRNLGDMLLEANLIDEVQMKIALEEQKRTGRKFGSTLVDLKFVDENVLAAFLSKQVDIPCISLLHIDIPKKILRKMPAKLARECHAIPVRLEEGRLEVALADPTDIGLIDKIEEAVGLTVVPLIAPQSSLEKMVERFYPSDPSDDTLASARRGEMQLQNPIFLDLIEEIENGDYGQRLAAIEVKLDEVWTLLEKVLRRVEALHPDEGTRPGTTRAADLRDR